MALKLTSEDVKIQISVGGHAPVSSAPSKHGSLFPPPQPKILYDNLTTILRYIRLIKSVIGNQSTLSDQITVLYGPIERCMVEWQRL